MVIAINLRSSYPVALPAENSRPALLNLSSSSAVPSPPPRAGRAVHHPIPIALGSSLMGAPAQQADFLIADLKLRSDHSIKILELGGIGSDLEPYKKIHAQEDLKRSFFEVIARQNCPMFCVYPSQSDFSNIRFRRMGYGYDAWVKAGGIPLSLKHFCDGLENRKEGRPIYVLSFIPRSSLPASPFLVYISRTMQPLIRDKGMFYAVCREYAPEFHPRTVLLNGVNRLGFSDRIRSSLLDQLSEAGCPSTPKASGDLPNPAEAIQALLDYFHGRLIVLKPLYASMGAGVEFREKAALVSALEVYWKAEEPGSEIDLEDSIHHHRYHRYDTPGSREALRWGEMGNELLLEEYVAGRPVRHPRTLEYYDPTMRLVFGLFRQGGRLLFYPLDAYWKLPDSPIGDGNQGRTKSVSPPVDVLPVDENDFQTVVRQMVRFLSRVYPYLNEGEGRRLKGKLMKGKTYG